jgi:hypothetical protein
MYDQEPFWMLNWMNPLHNERIWLLVPIISIGGVLLGLVSDTIFLLPPGAWGCVIGSFLLAYLALRKPKKDLVALLTPVYAVLIFGNPEFREGWILPILYAASLTFLVLRLNARFSTPNPPRSTREEDLTEEDEEDEELPE